MRRSRPRLLGALLGAVLAAAGGPARAAEPPNGPAFFHGLVVPMVTPFDLTGEHVDLAALRAHTKWLVTKPVSLLFPVSGLGQWRRLTLKEKEDIIVTVIDAAQGLKPVSPGITSLGPDDETIALGHFAEQHGAYALTVAIPDRLLDDHGPTQQAGLYRFFRNVHDATHAPIFIYDSQGSLDAETATRIAALPRIVAIKYRTKDSERLLRMVHAAETARAGRGHLAVLAGVEHEGVAALASGAVGIVGGGANLFPQLIDKIFKRFAAGDIAGAREATFAVIDANDGVPGGQEIKYALSRYYGIPIGRGVRGVPYDPLTIGEKDALDRAMRAADPALAKPETPLLQLAAAGQAKAGRYAKLSPAAADADGFIHNKCDGVTFTALNCIARGLSKAVCPAYKAEDAHEPGLWYRHAQHDCFEGDGTSGGSRSDNSPDVFTSLALMFWQYRDLDAVARVIAYGEHHDWIMGRSRKDVEAKTVAWSDDLRALYYELRFRLGGGDSPHRKALIRTPDLGDGWASHVAANRLLLIALMTEDTTPAERKALAELAQREPDNGLYQALAARLGDGDEAKAWTALLDPKHFPADALPTSRANHCEEYLFQRDERDGSAVNANWLPCPNEAPKTHSGTDLLWTACVLTPGCLQTTPVPQPY